MLTRPIPATGEQVPVIGMGSGITLNVGDDQDLRDQRVQVLQSFFDRGGAVIDSSPMYGSSEEVIGSCLARLRKRGPLFSATKVWTPLQMLGPGQMADSRELWGVERFDLMQIHNLMNTESHLERCSRIRPRAGSATSGSPPLTPGAMRSSPVRSGTGRWRTVRSSGAAAYLESLGNRFAKRVLRD